MTHASPAAELSALAAPPRCRPPPRAPAPAGARPATRARSATRAPSSRSGDMPRTGASSSRSAMGLSAAASLDPAASGLPPVRRPAVTDGKPGQAAGEFVQETAAAKARMERGDPMMAVLQAPLALSRRLFRGIVASCRVSCSGNEFASSADLDSNWYREQLLSIPLGIESSRSRFQSESRAVALDSNWNREQLLSTRIRVLSIPIGIQSSALDSDWNREQVLSIPVGFERKCSRFQLESRALALDSTWIREHLLSTRVGIESTALRSSWHRDPLLSILGRIERGCSRTGFRTARCFGTGGF